MKMLVFFSLLVTVVSIVVAVGTAIYTARVPYKRKIKVGCASIEMLTFVPNSSPDTKPEDTYGLSVQATNLGRCDTCITAVGLAVQMRRRHNPKKDLPMVMLPLNPVIRDTFPGSGMLKPGTT